MYAARTEFDERTETTRLVLAAQAGDREAFGTLVLRFERSVFAAALKRLRNYTEAQELAQDVFIQALQKLDQLRTPEAFGGWLRAITHRMAINRIVRRRPSAAADPESLSAYCVDRRTPLDAVLESEREGQLRCGISQLRAMDREALEAYYVRGQSLREIGDALELPLGTVKRRLHVARKRLARRVEQLQAV